MMPGPVIDQREYPSTRRGSDSVYTCKKWLNGEYTCDCPGWRFKKAGQPRGCSHCEWFKNNYRIVSMGDAAQLSMADVRWDKVAEYPNGLWLIRMLTVPGVPAQVKTVDQILRDRVEADRVRRQQIREKEQERNKVIRKEDVMESFVAVSNLKVLKVKAEPEPKPKPTSGRVSIAFDEEV